GKYLPVDDRLRVATAARARAVELVLEAPRHDLEVGLSESRIIEQAHLRPGCLGAPRPFTQLSFVPRRDLEPGWTDRTDHRQRRGTRARSGSIRRDQVAHRPLAESIDDLTTSCPCVFGSNRLSRHDRAVERSPRLRPSIRTRPNHVDANRLILRELGVIV